jgi:hypothetical protein
MRTNGLPRGADTTTVVGARTTWRSRAPVLRATRDGEKLMQSRDGFAESGSPPKPRDPSSAPSPVPDNAHNTVTRALRLAVGLCVAEHHDGIETLRRCVRRAREDGVTPERVVVLVHTAWDEYAGQPDGNADRDGKRLRLTGIALDAYFAAQ